MEISGLGTARSVCYHLPAGPFWSEGLVKNPGNGTMETWDIALLVVAGYVATFGLTRLMNRRREQLIEQFREQMEQGKVQSSGGAAKPPESRKDKAA